MTSSRPSSRLSRGLEVLRVINQERQSTVGWLHKATGLNKSTMSACWRRWSMKVM